MIALFEQRLRRFQRQRKRRDHRPLGVGELLGRNRHVARLAQLVEQIGQRRLGHFGAHLGARAPRAAKPRRIDERSGAVGVALGLAQIAEQPAGRTAADHLVQHRKREVVGIGPSNRLNADDQVGLHRVRPLDEVDARLRDHAGSDDRRCRRSGLLPAAEPRLDLLHRVGHRDVAGDGDAPRGRARSGRGETPRDRRAWSSRAPPASARCGHRDDRRRRRC